MINNAIVFKKTKKGLSERGSTLIELTVVILLLGFVFLSVMKLMMDMSVHSVMPEFRGTATMLAHEMVEEIRSKRFDELQNRSGTNNWSSSMGVDTGETATDRSTFDDVDDYHGWNETMTGSFNGFIRAVSVDYVNASDLDTVLSIPGTLPQGWTPDHKRVRVTVSHAAIAPVELVTVSSSVS